ncbi:MAG: two-component system sensor histidine kinase NtrB [Myxococcota bacterium]
MAEATPEGGAQSLDARAEQRLLWLMFARLALLLVSFAIAAGLGVLGRDLGSEAREGLYWTVSAAFLATVISGAVFPRVRSANRVAAAQLAIDVALVTALVHFSGGRTSVFAFLYPCVALYGAIFADRAGAFGAASLSALAYAGVLLAEHLGFAPGSAERTPPAMLMAAWGVQVGALFLVGALASTLAGELHRTGEALDRRTHALHRLRDLHQQTVESIMSGLLTTDSEYRVTSFNPEAERISGFTAAEVLGRPVDEVIPGARATLEEEAGDGQRRLASRGRLSFTNRAGDSRHLGLAGSPLQGQNGGPAGAVLIFQDVTNVVEMEAELRRSERMAAVGELGAKIAHEIRNPLAAISGSIEILRRGHGENARPTEPGSEAERLMDIVLRETDRLDGLITDFLDYARPRPPEVEPVAIAPLLEDLVKMLESARPPGIEVLCDAPPGLEATADANQLKQVIWNLAQNGLQAMDGSGRLVLSARGVVGGPQGAANASRNGDLGGTRAGPGEVGSGPIGVVEIAVADEGPGIAPEVQERMFEPFYTTKSQGTGLGLAMVHRIVESHGGVLLLESSAESGTTFRIQLPSAGGKA